MSNLTLDFAYAPVLPEYGTIAQILQGDLAQIGVTRKRATITPSGIIR